MESNFYKACLRPMGAKDLVRDGINGFVVEREDIGMIYFNIMLLLNKENRQKMAKEAYKVAAQSTWDRMSERVLEIYRGIAGK